MPDEEITIDQKAAKDLWKDILEIADKYAPIFAATFLKTINNQRRGINVSDLSNAIATGNQSLIDKALNWEKYLSDMLGLQDIFKKTSSETAKKTFELLDQVYNPKMTAAFRYIDEFASYKINNINKETFNAINELLAKSFRGDLTCDETAAEIRKFIGLNSRQLNALQRYEMQLRKEKFPEAQITKLVNQKRNEQLWYRAESIARTESMSASNYGNICAYKDMVERGVISKDKYQLGWMITPDDRLCSKCGMMKNKYSAIGGNFYNEGATSNNEIRFLEHPPLHPRCRCTTYLTTIKDPKNPNKPIPEKPNNRPTKPTRTDNRPTKPTNDIRIVAPGVEQKYIDETMKNYDAMPMALKKNVEQIVLKIENDKNDIELSKIYGYKVHSVAGYDQEDKTIYGFPDVFGNQQAIDKSFMAHELAHAIDRNLSSSELWNIAVAKNGFSSKYGEDFYYLHENDNDSLTEDFADSVKLYIIDNKNFFNKFPLKYDYLEKMYLIIDWVGSYE